MDALYILGASTCAISGVAVIYAALSRPESLAYIAEQLSTSLEIALIVMLLTGALHIAIAALGISMIIAMWSAGRKKGFKYIAVAASIAALLLLAGYIVGAIAMLIASAIYILKN